MAIRSTDEMHVLRHFMSGKRVWLSGHTGFKGAWLAQWLLDLGAEVHGAALMPPPTVPSLCEQIGLLGRISHEVLDVRDAAAVERSIREVRPDVVFHLAAQAIVRESYEHPVETWDTNVMGTVNVLNALRALKTPCAAVIITSDKAYDNIETVLGYRETDRMGGHDPYSSSKGAAEIAIASWRRAFFVQHPVRIASARAGNVVGGGDWAKDRIVPDCVRSLHTGQPIGVRNKTATRPWQHVLEPLSGYLWLAAVLSEPALRPYDPTLYSSAFNFGPTLDANRTVLQLVSEVLKGWPGRWEDKSDPAAVHEAKLLSLSTDKAFHLLGWKPLWSFEQTIDATVQWYRYAQSVEHEPGGVARLHTFTSRQIAEYEAAATGAGVGWALPNRSAYP